MTDEEILARIPSTLHPHLREKVACRLLRPVRLGSPEYHFVWSLLALVAAEPGSVSPRWIEIAREDAEKVDPAFVKRCYRVLEHVKTNVKRHAEGLLERLDQAGVVFENLSEEP